MNGTDCWFLDQREHTAPVREEPCFIASVRMMLAGAARRGTNHSLGHGILFPNQFHILKATTEILSVTA